ncbi:hypothetical protein NDU88_007246 [Pleurodeles waltl]|uniref:DDE Tnp4 domain-containing protein n=1 Tax=Pleurodeles waltl TaxID=8319 RepID=A0AAV7URS8_PLEWA|nr:hypothetical protein NDU88_007246 [Pleurodeles waltl]
MDVVEVSASEVCVLHDVMMVVAVDAVHAVVSADVTVKEDEKEEGETVEAVDIVLCATVCCDSGYPDMSWLLTPVKNARTGAENMYNDAHGRTRRITEQIFGPLKAR